MALGLVHRVVGDDVQQAAIDLASGLAAGPRGAYGRIKRLLASSPTVGLAEQPAAEADAVSFGAGTAEGREGVAAFLRRRADPAADVPNATAAGSGTDSPVPGANARSSAAGIGALAAADTANAETAAAQSRWRRSRKCPSAGTTNRAVRTPSARARSAKASDHNAGASDRSADPWITRNGRPASDAVSTSGGSHGATPATAVTAG